MVVLQYLRPSLPVALAVVVALPAGAAPAGPVPPRIEAAALTCLGEALRLCPEALTAKDHGASCILNRRRDLGRSCRSVYDEVAHGLSRHSRGR